MRRCNFVEPMSLLTQSPNTWDPRISCHRNPEFAFRDSAGFSGGPVLPHFMGVYSQTRAWGGHCFDKGFCRWSLSGWDGARDGERKGMSSWLWAGIPCAAISSHQTLRSPRIQPSDLAPQVTIKAYLTRPIDIRHMT